MKKTREQMTTLELIKEQRDDARNQVKRHIEINRDLYKKYDTMDKFIQSKGLKEEFTAFWVAERMEE